MSKTYNNNRKKSNESYISTTISLNTKYLVIVESPSKCKKIEHFLGLDYACIASNGHIQMIDGIKSIDIKNNFTPKFTPIKDKCTHIRNMKDIITKFPKENIILATDDDREGEAIAWHICTMFELPIETTPRIIFHEITKHAIEIAIKNKTIINMNQVHAQQARQVLDILVGYSISPYLWKYLYNNTSKALSAGRCQTPALKLVYENDILTTTEIDLKYKIKGCWTNQQIQFKLSKEFDNKDDAYNFLTKTKTYKHQMEKQPSNEVIQPPPSPFNTSKLLQTASNILNISPKETMSRCQTLYQNGLITYMRTESTKYSNVFVKTAGEYIIETYGSSKYVRNVDEIINSNTSLPHEAIRVTQLKDNAYIEDNKLRSLYNLILKNTIESCMSPARIMTTEIRISAPDKMYYNYVNEIPIWLGWLTYKKSNNDDTNIQNIQNSQMFLFETIISSKLQIDYQNISCEVVSRNTHSHYTEASLIKKLESLGIGRPSTFASIVDTIQDRGYVIKKDLIGDVIKITEYELEGKIITPISKEKTFGAEKQKLVIQPIGILTIEFLINNFDKLFAYEYTKNMEIKLDKQEYNSNDQLELCKETMIEINQMKNEMKTVTKQLFSIEPGYEYMFGRYGQIIKHTLNDKTIEYLPVKRDMNINLEKIKNGEYKLDDILEVKSRYIGTYNDECVYVKIGRYGAFIEYGNNTECIKSIDKPLDEIDIVDFEKHMTNKLSKPESREIPILRELTKNMSIRKGKYGAYVYYRRVDMKSPQFLNVKKCPIGYLKCEVNELVEWLCTTYKLPPE